MQLFEYEITSHPAESFKEMVYFCSEDGGCSIETVPAGQIAVLKDILNDKGSKGWELVHFAVGRDGLLIFWKRMISAGTAQGSFDIET